ncbi:hypothetical protein C8T65DRAFT_700347 [Cerioporus squamosus]|nr:hypothetical protein C8T65DRAFT_700347 [Cerioporus squamosus]
MDKSSNFNDEWEKGPSGACWRGQGDGSVVVYYAHKTPTQGRIAQNRGIRTRAILDYYKTARARKVADAYPNKSETASTLARSPHVNRAPSSVMNPQEPHEDSSGSPSVALPAQSSTAQAPSAHHQHTSYPVNSHRSSGQNYSQSYQSQSSSSPSAAPAENHPRSYQPQLPSASTAAPAQDHTHTHRTQPPSAFTAAPAQDHTHTYGTQLPSASAAAPEQNYNQSYQTQAYTAVPAQNHGQSYQAQLPQASTAAPLQSHTISYQAQLPTTSTTASAQYASDVRVGPPRRHPPSLPAQYVSDPHGGVHPCQQSSPSLAQYPADGHIVPASANHSDVPTRYSESSSNGPTYGEQYHLSAYTSTVPMRGSRDDANVAVHGQEASALATSHVPGPHVQSSSSWPEAAIPSFEAALATFDFVPQNPGYPSAGHAAIPYA